MANTRETMGEQACLDALAAKEIVDFEDDEIEQCRSKVFTSMGNLRSINLPKLKAVPTSFAMGSTKLASVNCPMATSVLGSAFKDDRSLTTANLPSANSISSQAFEECVKLTNLTIGNVSSFPDSVFKNCQSLDKNNLDISSCRYFGDSCLSGVLIGSIAVPENATISIRGLSNTKTTTIDFGERTSLPSISACYSLYHLILRNENAVCTLASGSTLQAILNDTPIIQGVGWVYVPENLLNDYKESTLWSSISSQIVSLDEYPKRLQNETISDSWSAIAASNTYATDYPIGSIKYIDIDGYKVAMELIAVDTDDLADGGKAKMTWLSKGVISGFPMIFDSSVDSSWEDSDMRDYLRQFIFPRIEQDVRSSIKTVVKTYNDYDGTTRSTSDSLWVPSQLEVFNRGESSGCNYGSYFVDSTKIAKKGYGVTNLSTSYWLRTCAYSKNFLLVGGNGTIGTSNQFASNGIVLGFCI